MSVADDLRATLSRLRSKGWRKRCWGSNEGPNCLVGAYKIVTSDGLDIYNIVPPVIREQYPDRHDGVGGQTGIAWWNDHPDTTFADVERVLEKAILRAEEIGL